MRWSRPSGRYGGPERDALAYPVIRIIVPAFNEAAIVAENRGSISLPTAWNAWPGMGLAASHGPQALGTPDELLEQIQTDGTGLEDIGVELLEVEIGPVLGPAVPTQTEDHSLTDLVGRSLPGPAEIAGDL